MNNSTVSIIIPIYNSGAYLHKCLDSVIDQTFKDIEIICVDDGSTDGSGEILDEYAEKDERVKVIHKENGGVSTARNAGLKAAGGGYIAFIDHDDYIAPDYIETLYKNMDCVDAVACGCRSISNGMETSRDCPENKTYTAEEIKNAYINKKNPYKFYRTPYGKLYRRSIIGNLRFDESIAIGAEDIIFNIYFLQRACAIRTLSYCGYNIREVMESISHKNALRYAEFTTNSYMHYRELKTAALKSWGFSDECLQEEQKNAAPHIYFNKVLNLVLPGTPYTKKEIRGKIKEIHADKELMEFIHEQKYSGMSLHKKIAKLSAQLNNSYLTEIMFCFVTRVQNTIIRSRRLSMLILGRRKR